MNVKTAIFAAKYGKGCPRMEDTLGTREMKNFGKSLQNDTILQRQIVTDLDQN